MKLRIKEILEQKGKTKYWLYMQLGLSYQNFNNMITNKTKSIKYEMIENLCEIFDCSIEDLFVVVDE